MEHSLSPYVYEQIIRFQRAELDGSILHELIAERQKDADSKAAMLEIA